MARSSPPRRAAKSATNNTHATRDARLPWAIGVDLSSLAVLERLFVRMPVRLLRARNNALDQLFYDVEAIPPAKRRELLQWSDPDGSIVVVHPGNGSERDIDHFEQLDKFLAWRERHPVDIVAMAGVGSSALGTAALAANVADALAKPVAGIVSGYGVADALTEGLVGWFVLRPYNQLRQLVDGWLAMFEPLLAAVSADTQPNGDAQRLVTYVRGLPETDTLDALLCEPRVFVATIVGHSKGNLGIAAALDNLPSARSRMVCPKLSVVTLGALVQLPATLRDARQFIGMLDGFGLLNSILPQMSTVVPWATHTLNTRWPFHLAAAQTLAANDAMSRAAFDRAAQAVSGAMRAPASLAQHWIDACLGAAAAFEGAFGESVRSLQQGAQHAASRARANVH
ncbi:MAG: hypothetical protein ACXWUB_02380 [Burkholderiales bacterium]